MKITFSRYSTFLTCPKKFYWAYIKNLAPISEPGYLDFGKKFHAGVEGVHGEEDDPTLPIPVRIGIVARRHFHRLPGEQSEVKVNANLNGIEFEGVVDAVADNAIIEYKTTSIDRSAICSAMELSLQTRLYAMVTNKTMGIIRLAKKSRLRERKDENEMDFSNRVVQQYVEAPNEMFEEITVPNINRPGVVRELTFVYDMIQKCIKDEVWPCAAPYACATVVGSCPYMEICCDPTFTHLYREKENG